MAGPEETIVTNNSAGLPPYVLPGTAAEQAHALIVIENLMTAALLECCPVSQYDKLKHSSIFDDLKQACAQDLLAFSRKDPASGCDIEVIARSCTSYAAVLHYRIAHWMYESLLAPERAMLAAMMTRRGKLLSGAEIHFKCRIGKRFVLDHGYGTVIGETAVIGDDCYVLGGVTLGSRQIADNMPGPRHPHLGDRIQVGMHASLPGRISIGNDAFIGAGCLVIRDVPAGHKVTQHHQTITI
jgi:serine O-acetyltransferase